jgi:hypothetical protein
MQMDNLDDTIELLKHELAHGFTALRLGAESVELTKDPDGAGCKENWGDTEVTEDMFLAVALMAVALYPSHASGQDMVFWQSTPSERRSKLLTPLLSLVQKDIDDIHERQLTKMAAVFVEHGILIKAPVLH